MPIDRYVICVVLITLTGLCLGEKLVGKHLVLVGDRDFQVPWYKDGTTK